ncbi:MAG: glycosyltransferase family 2 protein [Pseudonocardiaceae bacterium]
MHNDAVPQPKLQPTQRSYGDALAVVTVTYSPGEALRRFLETLDKATSREFQVVLADNGSMDGEPERAADREGVHLMPMGGNLGYGTAANQAIAALDDSIGWVVVANPDLEWDPDAIDTLLEAGSRWPHGASFGPLIRRLDGSVYPSARLLPSLGRGMGHAVFGGIWPANPWTRDYLQERAGPSERAADWLSGSCLLLRREAFDSVGGFDARYFMYFEDVDLGDRLGQAGWLNIYVPSAGVMHLGAHSTSRVSSRMSAVHHDSAYRYLADRHRGWLWRPVLALIRLGLALRLWLDTRRDADSG